MKKVKFIDPEYLKDWHKVYYRASQVERSLRREDFKVGLRLAVLDNVSEFSNQDNQPNPIFYTGEVTNIFGSDPNDQLVTIKYDGHPNCISVTFGIKEYARYCIPIPKHTIVKSKTYKLPPIKSEDL